MGAESTSRVRAAMEPAWNELREQRVLGRVLEGRRQYAAAQRRQKIAGAVLTAVAAAVLVGVFARNRHAPTGTRGSTAVATAGHGANTTASPHAQPARLRFVDGSEATLLQDARVQVDEERVERVLLTQTAGEVHYSVYHDPSRPFVVRVAGAEVRVRGTEFTVSLRDDAVEVRVQHGRVEVADGERSTVLVDGEALRVVARTAAPAAHDAGTSAALGALTPAVVASSAERRASSEGASARAHVPAPTVEALLSQVDEARSAGNYNDAADALRQLTSRYPHDPRVASALFTLGRVERSRGRNRESAEAFARCWQSGPRGSLAEDALAEEAASWISAGQPERARAAARRYQQRYPAGPQVARMRALLQ